MAEEEQQLVFDDALFRQKRKHGRFRLVEPPRLAGPVVDTHAHVHLLADPALEFARCAAWGVGFVCDIIDVQEDAPNVFAFRWDANDPGIGDTLVEFTLKPEVLNGKNFQDVHTFYRGGGRARSDWNQMPLVHWRVRPCGSHRYRHHLQPFSK